MKRYWYDHDATLILDTEWPVEKQIQSLATFLCEIDASLHITNSELSDMIYKADMKENND
jgi:hypothetical protein